MLQHLSLFNSSLRLFKWPRRQWHIYSQQFLSALCCLWRLMTLLDILGKQCIMIQAMMMNAANGLIDVLSSLCHMIRREYMSRTLRLIYEQDPLFTFIDCCCVKSLLFKGIGYSSCYRQRNENVTPLSKDTEIHA